MNEASTLPLPLTVGLALARTVEQFTDGVEPKLKWPNDVYIGDQKLAGILIESSIKQPNVRVIGVGINIATRLLIRSTTWAHARSRSSRNARGIHGDTNGFNHVLKPSCNATAESLDRMPELIDEYRRRCPLTNQEVQFYKGNTLHSGILLRNRPHRLFTSERRRKNDRTSQWRDHQSPPHLESRLASTCVLEKVTDPDGAKHTERRSGHRGQPPFPQQNEADFKCPLCGQTAWQSQA